MTSVRHNVSVSQVYANMNAEAKWYTSLRTQNKIGTAQNNESTEDALKLSKHLFCTKFWFIRISWSNKKRFILALLKEMRSMWALSLILKSIWTCRPKDSILSAYEGRSSYDQVPMDNNRGAMPMETLVTVMTNERRWFHGLDPESQAIVIAQLLMVSGGPIMWEVLKTAQLMYEKSREAQLSCITHEAENDDKASAERTYQSHNDDKIKQDKQGPTVTKDKSGIGEGDFGKQGKAQKELEAQLARWNQAIKAMRDSLKLEEQEVTFKDGTKRKIWKVNRPKPEVTETVDEFQQLPSALGKRILSYLPRATLGEYARVNKYWAYLVDDLKAELAARVKINADMVKLQELMFRHDSSLSLEQLVQENNPMAPASSQGVSIAPSLWQPLPSTKVSDKSAFYSMRQMLMEGNNRKPAIHRPIHNMAELSDRLNLRGAADENLPYWCENIVRQRRGWGKDAVSCRKSEDGVLKFGNCYFPCPLLKTHINLPLKPPLSKDFTVTAEAEDSLKRNVSNATLDVGRDERAKRFSLWSKDFSGLYPVYKIPSHQTNAWAAGK